MSVSDKAIESAASEACFSVEGVRWWAASDQLRAEYTRRAHAQHLHAANPTQDCKCGCNANAGEAK